MSSDSIQFDYYKSQYKKIEKLHVELYDIGFKDEIIESISEPILIRRTLHFKQLIDSDFNENSKEINNSKIKEAIVLYTKSITSMNDVYLNGVEKLIEQRLKPYLAEQELYNPQNWFELKNKTFNGLLALGKTVNVFKPFDNESAICVAQTLLPEPVSANNT